MTGQIIEPNSFELHAQDTQISYSTTSFIGESELTYNTLKLSRQFRGDEISTLETEIGKLVTVLVEPDADTGKEIRLTLLVPTINLVSDGEKPIQTEAILTTQRTPQRGRPSILEGQIQTYDILRLTGTAKIVNFLSKIQS
ncbi:MAG: hypothetical protein PUP93_14860 [Rhizonema sp. NSF051]|nr:hypothetical protein [Rhizonema sp. NSF051]